MKCSSVQSLQGFEHRAVRLNQQSLRHMQPIIRIDADQMRIECGVMDLRERNAVWHDGLAQSLVLVSDDVGGVSSFNRSGGYDPTDESAGLGFRVASEATAVPEPSSWAMMVIGVGLYGLARRSRSGRYRFG